MMMMMMMIFMRKMKMLCWQIRLSRNNLRKLRDKFGMISLFSNKNVFYYHSLELSCGDNSNEGSQHMF